MRYKFIFLFSFLFSTCASAEGWTGAVKITGVFVVNENQVILQLSQFPNTDDCKVNQGHIPDAGHVMLNSAENKFLSSLVLTAYASQKDVNVYYASCEEVWTGMSYGKVYHIRSY